MWFILNTIFAAGWLVKNALDEWTYEGFEEAYKEKPEEPEVVPKGYYKCIDCGKICKRLNASQKRCADCQKIHAKELERAYDKKRRR